MSHNSAFSYYSGDDAWHIEETPMDDKEREEAISYANTIIDKIRERLETDISIRVITGISSMSVMFGTNNRVHPIQLFSIGPGKLLVGNNTPHIYSEKDKILLSAPEEQIIEESVNIITSDSGYVNKVIVKRLGNLNENFSRLFDFLRESVELVPGSERVDKISEDFASKVSS
ncbi:hypothetical protein [Brazilian marseillevirus]|uniref:hypothetical protein n=1 Tax=Brazilian marseillevirus TaxID=1813599 RepID=UPI000783A562|nr:hypothetical protein A3303_gp487 [Brazilian marseillevirus]AMQ10995.1 hypothetical protein [Brazilian marseillevirus]